MEHRLDRIEEKVDALKEQVEAQKESSVARSETINRMSSMIMQMNDKMSEHTEILAQNTADLKYHIKRTDLLETKIVPLSEMYLKVQGGFKLIGMICSGVGLIFAAIKAVEVLKDWI